VQGEGCRVQGVSATGQTKKTHCHRGGFEGEHDFICKHISFVNLVSIKQTHFIYKLGFNQIYYTFTSILLKKIVMCSKFP